MNRAEWLERLATGGDKKHTGGIVYNKEQVNAIMGSSLGRLTAIIYHDEKTGVKVEFFTNNHIYGYPDLGDEFTSCSMSFPSEAVSRPGCEDGVINTHDKYLAVHKTHRTLWTVEEVIDFLAELGKVDEEEHHQLENTIKVDDPLEFLITYITAKHHVWDESRYIKTEVHGTVTFLDGIERDQPKTIGASFGMQYCLGSAFASGWIGDMYFKLYYTDHQGFQVYCNESYDAVQSMDSTSFSEPYYRTKEVMEKLIHGIRVYN